MWYTTLSHTGFSLKVPDKNAVASVWAKVKKGRGQGEESQSVSQIRAERLVA
jgi:hypothetical protein